MQQTTTTRYLNECLKLIDHPELPEILKEGVFWTKAIVLINKASNPLYALAVRGEDGKPVVSKCFTMHPIMSIDEIYPYEVDKKIVKKAQDTLLPNFDEWKAKLKAAKQGKNHPNYGKKRSDETKRKSSESNCGQTRSAEARVKMSAKAKERCSTPLICPHCAKEGFGGNIYRYHFNNCKFKTE